VALEGSAARGSGIAGDHENSQKPATSGRLSPVEADSVLQGLWDEDVVAWDRYWVPVFRLFARDLVADASLTRGDAVLDVGTGTGVAAIEACRAIRSAGLVVGIDQSEPMIELARKKAARARLRNLRFLKMAAEDLHFPDGFFDAVTSNCGMGIPSLAEGIREVLRVLRPSGVLVFNEWHLIDVEPHRVFGEVLGECRTRSPSPELARERAALASMESFHHSLSPETQKRIVHEAGFGEAKLVTRKYRIRMQNVKEYVGMRLCRATIKREMAEMSTDQHALFASELNERLGKFVLRKSFVFDWNVFYIRAKKPR